MVTEPIEGEIVNPNGTDQRALTLREKAEVIDVDHAVQEWEAYQDLTRRLLNASDYQKIGKREFKKKSAWRKYARAFNVSCEIISTEITRGPDGYPLFARIVVRATDPSGRYQDGEQECHVKDRCCPRPCPKIKWNDHRCCESSCSGRVHFSHAGDLPATAATRAKNRAIADLIGAGEVSAEEMREEADDPPVTAPQRSASKRPAQPAGEERVDPRDDSDGQRTNKARADLRKVLGVKFPDEQERWGWVKALGDQYVTGTEINYAGLTYNEAVTLRKLAEAGTVDPPDDATAEQGAQE